MWGCPGCGGIVGFGPKDLDGMRVSLSYGLGPMELGGRNGITEFKI
jgi:hypothetical protein